MTPKSSIFAFIVVCFFASAANAHPVIEKHHDRTIVVRLQKGGAPNQISVRVEYRLEVDEATVFRDDMKPFKDQVNPLDYQGQALKFYAEFTRIYAPIYADRFVAEVNGKPIAEFRCLSRKERLDDEDGKGLGHLRCDFVFESAFELDSSGPTRFLFQDKTYYDQPGKIVLTVINETGLALESKTEPDEALRTRAQENLGLGDYDRLREVAVVFAAPRPTPKTSELPAPRSSPKTSELPAPRPSDPRAATTPEVKEPKPSHDDRFSLIRLIMQDYGFWLTMLLALLFGAAHALTPGHGKTLVAAYLVGERGTIWHALFLGLVTTLTHTGVVILLAVILTVLPEDMRETFEKVVQNGLGLVLGLMIACMGFWLLLQRLTGKADHFHIGGGHHHHHGPTPEAPVPAARSLNWWGLVMLGVTGGIVPCWDAIALLFYAVGSSRVWIVLPAILAFSAGLAGVLVLIGILVVQMPRLVKSQGGDGRVLRALPTISAIAVILVGIWLCYEWSQGG